jgi:NAD(P)-dependent dehydrogenase (short-subunit alcohol dehydrogenase family)
MGFSGRTVLVTGAAGNLGRAVAEAFAALGANLVLLDVAHDRLISVFGRETDRTLLLPTDLLSAVGTQRAVTKAVERFGGVDVLCNITGGFRMGETVHETTDDTLDFLFDVNVRTLVHAARAVVPHMLSRKSGKIVNVAAYAAQKGAARMGVYAASKSAVIRLTEAMAAELREKHINVNCVLPTIIDTADNRAAMPDADPARWVAPQDLADVIVFLASDKARAIHGAAIPVAGLTG